MLRITVVRGGTVRAIGFGFKPGAKVTVDVCGVERFTTTARASGHVSVLIKIPENTPLGACRLTLTGPGANNQTLTLTATVIVKIASKTVLKLSLSKVTYGHEQVEHLSVTVSPLSRGPKPTGKVAVHLLRKPKRTLCVIQFSSGKGSCGLSPRRLKPGIYHLVATYGGSTTYFGSTSSQKKLAVAR
ncbi:MAG: Ig-like domain-containing protein [Acidimicrobiales bacterium]